jgi:hypothetical protein
MKRVPRLAEYREVEITGSFIKSDLSQIYRDLTGLNKKAVSNYLKQLFITKAIINLLFCTHIR